MALWALGLNHQTAPLDLRGQFAFGLDQIRTSVSCLRKVWSQPPEAAILSTCNRTEIYGASDSLDITPALEWLAQSGGVSRDTLLSHVYTLEGDQAARHAFRVACGLDSMVLGEPQILGQLKEAVRAADDVGALGQTLHQLFQRSFAVAKAVRSSTDIGAHSISMAAAAVRLAGQIFEDLHRIHVLFVGAGDMIALAATHFVARQPQRMVIANRSIARAEQLAAECHATVMPLSDLPFRLHEFDAVISCTASTLPLIGLGAVEKALKLRRHRPMFMVDLAVPRDIEPEIKNLSDVYLYTVDDLAGLVQTGKAQRQAAVLEAETIIEASVDSFAQWLHQRDPLQGVVPLIQQLQSQTEGWRLAELARAKKALAKGESVETVLDNLTKGLTQKMLHGPLTELRSVEAVSRDRASEAIRLFFLRQER
jgi:glutamyl-tRNA reductase